MSFDDHCKQYGYNFKDIPYPISSNEEFQRRWHEHLSGKTIFPNTLQAEFDESVKCNHGRVFSNLDDDVKQVSKNMKIFHGYDTREEILPIPVFSRVTIGNMCACTQQVDTTDLFLWNLVRGLINGLEMAQKYTHFGNF